MILKMDIKSSFGKGRRVGFKNVLKFWLGPALFLLLGAGAGYGSYRLFLFIEDIASALPGLGDLVSLNLFNGLTMYVLLFVFLSGLQITFRTLYESDDIGFLLAQPVPARSVFVSKFISVFFALTPLVMVFTVPEWFAWGYVNGAGASFYVMVVLSTLALLLLVYSLLVLILLLVMRFLPGARLKRLFVVLGSLLGLLIVLSSQLLSSRMTSVGDTVELLQKLGSLDLSKTWYLPTTWAINTILGTLERFHVSPWGYGLPLVVFAGTLAQVATKAAENWYFVGWSGLAEETPREGGKKRARHLSAQEAWAGGSVGGQGTFMTVLRKDVKLLFRDPVLWYGLATTTIGLGFYIYNLGRGPTSAGASFDGARSMMSILTVAMMAFMGSVVSSQTGGISLSREGPVFWMLQANPTEPGHLFRAKLAYAMLPSVVLMFPFFIVLQFTSLPLYPLWRLLVVGLSLTVAVSTYQICFDSFFPDFTIRVEIGSSKSGKGAGKLMTVIFSSMIVLMVFVLVLALPSILVGRGTVPESSFDRAEALAHGGVVGLSLLMGFAGNHFGSKRVGKLLKSH